MNRKFLSLFTETHNDFQGQEENEKIILNLRQHPFVLAYPALLIFLSAFLPLLVKLAFPDIFTKAETGELFLFLSSLWYTALWLFGFYILTMYALNTVIITDRRIVENEQIGLFNRRVAELHLYRVQDVATHTEGFIETLLSFGTVSVQTAAEEREFVFKRVPHPERIKDAIMQAVNAHRTNLKLS